jgi:ATP-dependent Clp protease ATP-binding subunit ClpB
VLFDEIEKAHPDVFNILLQLLDDGRLTDNQGRTVDFKNTIIIMTSNIGSAELLDNMNEDGTISPEVEEHVTGLLRKNFRPEFINRIDDIILFSPLTKEQIKGIIGLSFDDIRTRLENRDISLEVTEEALDFIADEAYDPHYGARPIKRFLQQNVETEIAEGIIRGTVLDGQTLVCDSDGGKLIYKTKEE